MNRDTMHAHDVLRRCRWFQPRYATRLAGNGVTYCSPSRQRRFTVLL